MLMFSALTEVNVYTQHPPRGMLLDFFQPQDNQGEEKGYPWETLHTKPVITSL